MGWEGLSEARRERIKGGEMLYVSRRLLSELAVEASDALGGVTVIASGETLNVPRLFLSFSAVGVVSEYPGDGGETLYVSWRLRFLLGSCGEDSEGGERGGEPSMEGEGSGDAIFSRCLFLPRSTGTSTERTHGDVRCRGGDGGLTAVGGDGLWSVSFVGGRLVFPSLTISGTSGGRS